MGLGQGQDVDGVLGDARLADLAEGGDDLVLQGRQPVAGAGGRGLGGHRLARRAAGQEDRGHLGEGPVGLVHPFGARLVGDRTGVHQLGHLQPFAPVEEAHEVGLDRRHVAVGIGADEGVGADRGVGGDAGDIVDQPGAVLFDAGQQTLETGPVELDGEMGIGAADATVLIGEGGAGQVLSGAVGQGQGGLVLQHGEAGGDPGLQREAAQQLFAEGVQGLDLQPARRVERLGEEVARLGKFVG